MSGFKIPTPVDPNDAATKQFVTDSVVPGPQGPIGNTGPQGPIGNTGPQGPVAAPLAQYVALATDAGLTNERVLTGTANRVSITDNGAKGSIVLATPQDIHTAANPIFNDVNISRGIELKGIAPNGTAPAAGSQRIEPGRVYGPSALSYAEPMLIDPPGKPYWLQKSLGHVKVGYWTANGNGATVSLLNFGNTITGTAT